MTSIDSFVQVVATCMLKVRDKNNPANIYLFKSTTETLEKSKKSFQS